MTRLPQSVQVVFAQQRFLPCSAFSPMVEQAAGPSGQPASQTCAGVEPPSDHFPKARLPCLALHCYGRFGPNPT